MELSEDNTDYSQRWILISKRDPGKIQLKKHLATGLDSLATNLKLNVRAFEFFGHSCQQQQVPWTNLSWTLIRICESFSFTSSLCTWVDVTKKIVCAGKLRKSTMLPYSAYNTHLHRGRRCLGNFLERLAETHISGYHNETFSWSTGACIKFTVLQNLHFHLV